MYPRMSGSFRLDWYLNHTSDKTLDELSWMGSARQIEPDQAQIPLGIPDGASWLFSKPCTTTGFWTVLRASRRLSVSVIPPPTTGSSPPMAGSARSTQAPASTAGPTQGPSASSLDARSFSRASTVACAGQLLGTAYHAINPVTWATNSSPLRYPCSTPGKGTFNAWANRLITPS